MWLNFTVQDVSWEIASLKRELSVVAFGKVKVIYVECIFAHCSLVFDRYLHKNIHKKT